MKPYSDEWHRAFGLHSNIPECCVTFFVDKWRSFVYTEEGVRYTRKILNWKYVPCPDCVSTKRVNKLHYCDRGCSFYHDCHADFPAHPEIQKEILRYEGPSHGFE